MINGGLLNPVESQDKLALENVKIKGRKKKILTEKEIVKVRAYVVHRKPIMIKFLLFGIVYHKKQYRVYIRNG